MATENSPQGRADRSPTEGPRQDPWSAFGYMVSGVAVYGLAGWGLDRWWGTNFMVAIGIVAGAGLGIYMTMKAFPASQAPDDHKN